MMTGLWVGIASLLIIALLIILVPLHHKNNKNTKTAWGTGVFIILILPIAAIGFYLSIGNSSNLKAAFVAKEQLAAAQKLRISMGTPLQVIDVLKQRVEQNANDPQGWFLLGRLYMSQQQLDPANQAFAKAYALAPNNPAIIFEYAQGLYIAQHSLTGKPAELLQQLLKQDPHNALALNLLAVAAYQQGAYPQAIKLWEQLLPNYPAGSPDNQALLEVIAKAQAALAKQRKSD